MHPTLWKQKLFLSAKYGIGYSPTYAKFRLTPTLYEADANDFYRSNGRTLSNMVANLAMVHTQSLTSIRIFGKCARDVQS